MTTKEIKQMLENAYHEIGHAYAFVGTPGRELSALEAVDSARDSIQFAHDALEEKMARGVK